MIHDPVTKRNPGETASPRRIGLSRCSSRSIGYFYLLQPLIQQKVRKRDSLSFFLAFFCLTVLRREDEIYIPVGMDRRDNHSFREGKKDFGYLFFAPSRNFKWGSKVPLFICRTRHFLPRSFIVHLDFSNHGVTRVVLNVYSFREKMILEKINFALSLSIFCSKGCPKVKKSNNLIINGTD